MEYKIVVVWISILTAYEPWHVHAAVDCTAAGAGTFIDRDDSTCTKFSVCLYLAGNCQYKAFDYNCPAYTIFDPALSICSATTNFVCKPKCTEEGESPDPDSTDCTSFLMCLSDGKGSFDNTVEKCVPGTLFDPTVGFCASNYVCPKKFSCSTTGYVANTSDKKCQSYYYCSLLANKKYVSYEYRCPGIWKFHPIFKVCTPFYNCE